MTDEQINRSIAVGCKWQPIFATHPDPWIVCWQTPLGETVSQLPNFCEDLNAMHIAEKTLDEDQRWTMARHIERNDTRWYFMATARERAEAFLRTLGKWEEWK